MAVVVGTYIVTGNNKTRYDYAYGLKYPFTMTAETFELSYDNITRLKANLKNLLSTKKGERLNQPLFGTDLHTLLFEQQTPELNSKIFESIEKAVARWLPQVTIQEIEVTSSRDMLDRGIMEIRIVFLANYNNELFDVEFKVQA